MFDGEYVQPFGTGKTVENAIWPHSVGPHLVFLKLALEGLAVKRMLDQVTEGFFDSFSRGFVEILEVFEGLRRESNLPQCSSPNTSLKE